LEGAVRTDTGESTFPVSSSDVIPITGTPDDDDVEYTITARADFTAVTPASASLVLYTTTDQQRTIRGGVSGSISFEAEAQAAATAPPRLAATGEPIAGAGLAAGALVAFGGLLVVDSGIRSRRRCCS
jgi:hypothetical protein